MGVAAVTFLTSQQVFPCCSSHIETGCHPIPLFTDVLQLRVLYHMKKKSAAPSILPLSPKFLVLLLPFGIPLRYLYYSKMATKKVTFRVSLRLLLVVGILSELQQDHVVAGCFRILVNRALPEQRARMVALPPDVTTPVIPAVDEVERKVTLAIFKEARQKRIRFEEVQQEFDILEAKLASLIHLYISEETSTAAAEATSSVV